MGGGRIGRPARNPRDHQGSGDHRRHADAIRQLHHAGQSTKGGHPDRAAPARRGRDHPGKTTTSEFGWTGVSHSPLTGITHNPWKHGYNAGASSAGAGAAAAAGFGPLHQGSDGAGSVRMPSHFCGIFGLKPTFGRVPYYPVGTGDFTSHIGPMTRTVADAGADAGSHGRPASVGFHYDRGGAGAISATSRRRHRRQAHRLQPGFGRRTGRSRSRGPGESGGRPLRIARRDSRGSRASWAADGPELARFFWPAHTARHMPRLAEWESKMDPGLVACIREGARHSIIDYQIMRERKMGVRRGGASMVPGLGLPADPRRIRRRLPG